MYMKWKGLIGNHLKMMKSTENNTKELDIREIQYRLLTMASCVCAILDEANIPYSIIDGTLLGAVRHGGFIPWDDDLDILIFDEYYDAVCETLRAKLPYDYFFEDDKSEPLYFHAWPHVKDRKTMVELKEQHQDSLYKCQGLAIDLYRARKMRYSQLNDYLFEEEKNYRKRQLHAGIIDQMQYSQLLERINEKEETKVFKGDDRPIYARITKYVTPFIYEEEMFPLKKYSFIDKTFWGPSDSGTILKRSYGDYMVLPAKEKRVQAYSKVELLD